MGLGIHIMNSNIRRLTQLTNAKQVNCPPSGEYFPPVTDSAIVGYDPGWRFAQATIGLTITNLSAKLYRLTPTGTTLEAYLPDVTKGRVLVKAAKMLFTGMQLIDQAEIPPTLVIGITEYNSDAGNPATVETTTTSLNQAMTELHATPSYAEIRLLAIITPKILPGMLPSSDALKQLVYYQGEIDFTQILIAIAKKEQEYNTIGHPTVAKPTYTQIFVGKRGTDNGGTTYLNYCFRFLLD